jgi:hypothetical protein
MGLRERKGKTAFELVASSKGLRCCKCHGFACHSCLTVVIDGVKRKKSRLEDNWCVQVQAYLHSGVEPKQFIGHCCEWLQYKYAGPKPDDFAGEERRYDGHLVLPEYGLLLDSPLDGNVDMHAFGNGDPRMKGVWHALVPEGVAIEAQRQKLVPDGTACASGMTKIVEITIPGLRDDDKQTVSSHSMKS